jgi:Lipocalin-like domain
VPTTEERLVGTYRVVAMEHSTDDGEVGRPFGDEPRGVIVYTAEHYMIAVLMRADRPRFAAGDILGGTESERAAAFATANAFAGRWELVDEEIVHHLEVTTFPNWVGTQQRRRFDLTDTHLTLYPPSMLMEGKLRRARVHCVRLRP